MVDAIYKFIDILRGLVLGSESAEGFFRRYISCFCLVIFIVIIILLSESHTHSLYREKLKMDKELKSVEAVYSRSNKEFRSLTLDTKIIDEVRKRNINIDLSENSPIIIE